MSTAGGTGRRDFFAIVAVVSVATLLVAGVLWWVLLAPSTNRFTAYFSSAVGLFSGSDVRVLGVKVGRIESVAPQGTRVEVVISVDKATKIPADASAISIAPSLVSDRYVQLAPAYTEGPTMRDGAEIPRERTANPLELDELYASLDRLTTALGPEGANKDGALSDLIEVGAQTLDGTGATFNQTLDDLSDTARTLADSRGDLFATVDNLQKFTSSLAANDAQVRQFDGRLAEVTSFLAGERTDLATSLQALTAALNDVSAFIRDNRAALKANVDKLTRISQLLVDQKTDLEEFLDVAPLGLSNLANAYNGYAGALETRTNLNELADPSLLLCRALTRPDAIAPGVLPALPQSFTDACKNLVSQLGETLGLPTPADLIGSLSRGELPPIPILGASGAATVPAAGGGR